MALRLAGLPEAQRSEFLAGLIAADAITSKRWYLIRQALLTRWEDATSRKWRSHLSVAEAASAVARSLGLGGDWDWVPSTDNASAFGVLHVKLGGPRIGLVREALEGWVPRRVPREHPLQRMPAVPNLIHGVGGPMEGGRRLVVVPHAAIGGAPMTVVTAGGVCASLQEGAKPEGDILGWGAGVEAACRELVPEIRRAREVMERERACEEEKEEVFEEAEEEEEEKLPVAPKRRRR